VKYDTLVEELHDSVSSLLNIYISLSSQRTNEVMRVLTVFSAFFLPLTFIVGVYGMNFSHMPELIHPYGYLGVWVVMLIVTILIFRWFKQKGWI
jgi:magnesium transporter